MTSDIPTAGIRHLRYLPDGSIVMQIQRFEDRQIYDLVLPPDLVAALTVRLRQFAEVSGVVVMSGKCPKCQTESMVPMSRTKGDSEGQVIDPNRGALGCWRCGQTIEAPA
jgi:hypothetical protein